MLEKIDYKKKVCFCYIKMNQNNKVISKYLLRKLNICIIFGFLPFVKSYIKYEISERLNDYYEIFELDKRNKLNNKK